MTLIDLSKLLENVIEKARQDNIITDDEESLIRTIEIETRTMDKRIREITSDTTTKSVLSRIITTAGRQMLKNVISKAREDGAMSSDEYAIIRTLIEELDLDLNSIESRPWFVFKICVNIDYKDDVDQLLNSLDKVFCLRGLDPNKVYSGLCLGTKHYVIDEVDVTLLAFAVTPDNTADWVTRGAFANIDYQETGFRRILERTAQDLVVENYLSKN